MIIPTRSASEEFSRFCLAGALGWYSINTGLATGDCSSKTLETPVPGGLLISPAGLPDVSPGQPSPFLPVPILNPAPPALLGLYIGHVNSLPSFDKPVRNLESAGLTEVILHAVMSARIGERHASACRYKKQGAIGLTPLRSPDSFLAARCIYRARLKMAHSFNRVGNAPRVGIHPAGRCSRGPLGTRLNKPMPTACGIVHPGSPICWRWISPQHASIATITHESPSSAGARDGPKPRQVTSPPVLELIRFSNTKLIPVTALKCEWNPGC